MMSPVTPSPLPTDLRYESYHPIRDSPDSRHHNHIDWTATPYIPPRTTLSPASDDVCVRGIGTSIPRTKRGGARRGGTQAGGKSSSGYKHVPHRDKPPHLVARRNARERRRVQAVNSAFARLRKCVPVENRGKRLSKVKTLHRAIEYISNLQELLRNSDEPLTEEGQRTVQHHLTPRSELRRESLTSPEDDIEDDDEDEDVETGDDEEFAYVPNYQGSLDKENENGQTWMTLGTNCDPNYGPYIPYYENYPGSLTS